MTYALVTGDIIQSVGPLPRSARRLDTGQWVMGLRDAAVELQQACGYLEVVRVDRPDDTASTTWDRSITLVGGIPTETWTERPKTQAEVDADTEAANNAAIQQAVTDALATLQTVIDDMTAYLGLSNPNNAAIAAQVRDNAQAIRELARNQRRLIRLTVGQVLDGTDGADL